MRTADFEYHLPKELIAQRPASPRDSSRLLVLERLTGEIRHLHFRDLPALLSPGDALIFNETLVIPARLFGRKIPGGGRVEFLLLKQLSDQRWEAMAGGKGLRPGVRVRIEGGPELQVAADLGGPLREIHFDRPIGPLLDRIGQMPLPPYIDTPIRRAGEYQTVFARHPGSAAAPTAGLHFTPELMAGLEQAGVRLIKITLHIGLDTFAPVTEEDPQQHVIHSEWCHLDELAAEQINEVRSRGGRLIAVGTTSVRTLETAALKAPPGTLVAPFRGTSQLFILPGFRFQAVDQLITNFHLPRSTLLMLVSAFAGRERILDAYRLAIERRYRFYSFGDAMLIR